MEFALSYSPPQHYRYKSATKLFLRVSFRVHNAGINKPKKIVRKIAAKERREEGLVVISDSLESKLMRF